MKKLKKIMLSIAVLALMIPLSMGLAACGDKGNATADSPIIGTWEFAANDNFITEVHVAVGQVTISISGPDPIIGGTKNATLTANVVKVNTDNFVASRNIADNQVWEISGSLVGGKLKITGTITTLTALSSAQGSVDLTSK